MTNTPTQSEAQVALLPCPFCGCQRVTLWRTDNPHGHFVSCANCGCCTPESIGVNDLASMEAATSKWNYRCMPREFGEDAVPAVPTPSAKRHSQPTVEGEAVAEVVQRPNYIDGSANPMHDLKWNLESCEDDLPVGTKLYLHPPHPQQSVAEWQYRAEKAEAELAAVTTSGAAADDALYRGNSVRYWYDKANAYKEAAGELYAIKNSKTQQSVAVLEGTLQEQIRWHQQQAAMLTQKFLGDPMKGVSLEPR